MILELTVLASVYWEDRYVSSGARFDPNQMAVASRSLPLGTCVHLKYRGREATAVVNDRGPCYSERCQRTRPDLIKRELDLTPATAKQLRFPGLGKLKYKVC